MTQSLARTENSPPLDALRKVIYELQAAISIPTLSEAVTAYLKAHMGYDCVWFGVYDAANSTLSGPWKKDSESNASALTLSVLPGDLFDQVLLTRRSATIANLQDEARAGEWQELAKSNKVQGTVLHAIRYQKESLGVLLIGTSKWGINPRQEDSEQFAILASTLGATLHYLQTRGSPTLDQQSDHESPHQPPSHLLQSLTQRHSWSSQLELISQELVQLAPISGLYLLDAESGDFVARYIHDAKEQRASRGRKTKHTLNFSQNISFFRILERKTNLGIGDITSSIDSSVPNTLVNFFKARAFLFQPILQQKMLRGFLVLANLEPRHWSQTEQETLTLCAHLIELIYPSSGSPALTVHGKGESVSRVQDCVLPSPLAEVEEWNKGLENWFRSLTKRFQCQWSLLLTYDANAKCYYPTQYFSAQRRNVLENGTTFKPLSSVDEKLIVRHDRAVDLENLEDELRFVAWRDQLLAQGIRSILVSHLAHGTELNELLVLGNTNVRAWQPDEAKDLQNLASELQKAFVRRELHVEMLQEKRLNQVFRQGLEILQTTRSSQSFIEKAARVLVDLFEVAGCGILLWPPRRKFAKVKAMVTPGTDHFSVPIGTKVDRTDPFIQSLLTSALTAEPILSPVELSSQDLAEETQSWLFTQGDWSLVGLALQPQPKQPIFGVLFLAHPGPIFLTESEAEALSDFVRHLAWVLCSSHIKEAWRKDYESLHTAHWYHNKTLGFAFEGILQQCATVSASSSSPSGQAPDAMELVANIERSVHSLYDQNSKLIPPLELNSEPVTLVRLLRELLDRLEATFASKQIWVQVHHLKQSNLTLNCSKNHLLYVLDEVLKAATVRSKESERIDIWCQINHPGWLDLSITDSGKLDPRFIRDLHAGHNRDRLKSSLVTEDLGHRLLACQSLIQLLGGKLEFQTMTDERTLTRFTLPCSGD